MGDTCDVHRQHGPGACVLDDGHDLHRDGRGNTWLTEAMSPPSPPEPALTVVRARCSAAMTAARHRAHGEPYDEAALAAAVPDIPILLNAVERLGHAVASLTAKTELLGEAVDKATNNPAEVGHD